jgi:hypothetical protein
MSNSKAIMPETASAKLPVKAVRVAWMDEGKRLRCMTGLFIDVASKLLHVQVPEPIPLLKKVSVQGAGLTISGSIFVKYVTRHDGSFVLALAQSK